MTTIEKIQNHHDRTQGCKDRQEFLQIIGLDLSLDEFGVHMPSPFRCLLFEEPLVVFWESIVFDEVLEKIVLFSPAIA